LGLQFVNDIKRSEENLLLAQNIWITFAAVPLFLIIREKPEHPPSLVSM
jgi:uncharacterized membrane protein